MSSTTGDKIKVTLFGQSHSPGMGVVVDGLPPGEEIAQRIYTRHKLLTQFLIRLGVSPEVAAADACKIEHDLSDESFEKIARHALGGGERDQ